MADTPPPAALQTYLRLRLLAGESGREIDLSATPPLALGELARRCGRSRSTMHAHLILLRALAVLAWAISGEHLWVVSFLPAQAPAPGAPAPAPPSPAASQCQSGIPDAGISKSEIPDALSLNPESINNLINPEERREARVPNPECPNSAYQQITGLRPNQPQRAMLAAQVTDLDRWRATRGHWLSGWRLRWNPKNLPGMLELYRRGGPSACRYCAGGAHAVRPSPSPTLAALAELREMYDEPNEREDG